MKKSGIWGVAITSIALLSAVILFMIKCADVVALNNDHKENMNVKAWDGTAIVMDYSAIFENGYSGPAENISTEGSMDKVVNGDIIMDYSTVFESE